MGRQTATNYIKYRKGSKVPVYDRDVPADVRHVVGKAKWKKSLRGLSLDDANAQARQLSNEHDAIVAAARGKNPLPSHPLGTDAISLAGGIDDLLKWFDRRAIDAAWLRREAESMREFAASDGPADEIPDPDWAASHTAALDAERHQINRQLARDAAHLRTLGKTPDSLRKSGLRAAADIIEANPRDRDWITLSGVLEEWKAFTKPGAPEQYEYPVKLFRGTARRSTREGNHGCSCSRFP